MPIPFFFNISQDKLEQLEVDVADLKEDRDRLKEEFEERLEEVRREYLKKHQECVNEVIFKS